MIRLFSGALKGLSLPFVADGPIRPTTQKVRSAVLNSLGASLAGASFADLFAGSGAVGLEALSRGASNVLLVEKDRKVHQTLERVLASEFRLRSQPVRLVREDALHFVKTYEGVAMDILFLDPPYGFPDWEKLLRCLSSSGIVQNQSTIILEYHHRDDPSSWVLAFFPAYEFKTTSYGESRILFARPVVP